MTDITIREERPGDEAAIHDMVRRAFIGHAYSDGDEQDVIDRLRDDGDLLLSLVAEADGAIIGQITYSPALLENGEEGWVVLGPVAVDPAHQGKGLGRKLIEAGEAVMRTRGVKGITVLGDPELYAHFGFAQNTPMWLAGELGWAFQVKSLGPAIPATEQRYVRAFDPPAS
ncbi:GNAT family N-acetyltransferase [Erythrobacter dokdonensis]|uniref:GCN5-related N-acetyltransferase n=1 Tax=Erythrobacter dokdonensis DSW-74 TaxID=1300349 RepID=A0A1A7BHZ3_9SPHN|nr:N-acetyltransferase [Erythrobacter dokdonensis]OBV11057.1 GCN5-related N-acetyltransferase [Erythrobacter dokdonensis DSW-74]